MKMTIKATGKRYIIKAEELATTTASGIIVKNSGATQFAIIVHAGPSVVDALPAGTRVMIDWNHTVPLKYEGVQYHVIESGALQAVVEE
jgi:co-chaperonin GroES (HSP10)